MDRLKKVAVSTKEFVVRHKVGVAVITTAAICLKINSRALREHDNFLKEHDLYEKFYTPEDEV